eukprot:CAMPEP_0181224874 /NCGR_PEP_ID=MMETSP1096-20121128/31377_1 /TAXON_ID=156174 ORGANISM="Chrysochromulina ericina, Strain CCMP281" /NCGR_SAMPLE_ID=MMETSP1096 /ASSEMBLY_ACC=CAM_ASM_000453 /LENGTH=156 /DNA_ID=CAMNT_0023318021 /DNA_START=48 /DNA_END=518 /DNA_ORIENTATION=+
MWRGLVMALVCSTANGFSLIGVFPGQSSRRMTPAPLAEADTAAEQEIVTFTDNALKQLADLRAKQNVDEIRIRMGVRAGGCSGMSYIMDMMKPEDQVEEGDTEVVYDGVRCVIDPKSLLFLYGLKLDYSDALIGGGFSFFNPNADETCGCGKSFGV